jgi:hypothetical protein
MRSSLSVGTIFLLLGLAACESGPTDQAAPSTTREVTPDLIAAIEVFHDGSLDGPLSAESLNSLPVKRAAAECFYKYDLELRILAVEEGRLGARYWSATLANSIPKPVEIRENGLEERRLLMRDVRKNQGVPAVACVEAAAQLLGSASS